MIKCKILISILIITFVFQLKAVESSRYWVEDNLKWSDFQGHPIYNSELATKLSYELGYRPEKVKYNGVTWVKYVVYARQIPSISWVNPEFKTDTLLKYNQVTLNIIELYRRKTQLNLNKCRSYDEVDSKFNDSIDQLYRRLDNFKVHADDGENQKAINYWYKKINQELEELKDYNFPKYSSAKLGLAFQIGLGISKPAGSLNKYFSIHPLMDVGMDVSYANSFLLSSVTIGGSRTKKHFFIDNQLWKKSLLVSFTTFSLSYGHSVYKNVSHQVIPFLGVNYNYLAESNSSDKDDIDVIDHSITNYTFGIIWDYNLYKKIDLIPTLLNINYKHIINWDIRTKLYISPMKYSSQLEGYTINFSVSISNLTNFVSLEN